jgi:hypothetical protein
MNPTITWHSVEQDLFVLKIYKDNEVIYNSEEVAGGTIDNFTVDEYLDNGSYVVGLRTSNIYGFWSNEILYPITIDTVKPSKPTIGGAVNDLYIAIIINSSTATNLIYRKGIKEAEYLLIATLSSNTYIDYAAPAGETKYFVRSVTENGYEDSDILSLPLHFDGIVLSDFDNKTDYIQLYNTFDNDKRKSISPTNERYLIKCNGREYPIQQSSEFRNHAENHEYFIHYEDFDKYYRIINCNTLLYRNNYGYSYVVGVSNPLIQENAFGYIVAFTLTRLGE